MEDAVGKRDRAYWRADDQEKKRDEGKYAEGLNLKHNFFWICNLIYDKMKKSKAYEEIETIDEKPY